MSRDAPPAPATAPRHSVTGGFSAFRMLPVSKLRRGMYVVDTGLPADEYPYLYARQGFLDEAALEQLTREGFREAFVDPLRTPDKALDLEQIFTGAGTSNIRREIPMETELPAARKVYSDSLRFAHEFIRDSRLGRQIHPDAAAPLVDGVLDSVGRNGDALLGLSKLRASDEYTYTHCINVSVLATLFGNYLGLDQLRLRQLATAALFHDMGKARVPESILNKPGRLTDEEHAIIKRHSADGFDLLVDQGLSDEELTGVRHHHERQDGSGYPEGLAGDAIGAYAQIIGVVDVYDALTSRRPYKGGMTPDQALKIMFKMRGTKFSQPLLDHFVKYLGIYPMGSLVQLNDGFCGLVTGSAPENPLRPTVKVVLDKKRRKVRPRDMDLAKRKDKSIIKSIDPAPLGIDPATYLLPPSKN